MKKLLCFLLITVMSITFFSCKADKKEDSKSPVESSSQTKNDGDLKVEFFNDNNIKLKEDFISEWESVQTPNINTEKPGYVFSGWDKDLNKLSKDDAGEQEISDMPSIVVKPEYVDVSDKSNVVAIPAVYKDSEGKLTVPIGMRGVVDFCGLDLKITYDAEVLSFVEFANTDPAVVVNHSEKKAEVYINFISSTNTTGDVDLSSIVFKSKSAGNVVTSLKVEIVEIIKTDGDDFVTPEHSIVSSKLYA